MRLPFLRSIRRVALINLPLSFLGFAIIRSRFGQTVDIAETTYYVDSETTYVGITTYYFSYACLLHICVFLGSKIAISVPFMVSSLQLGPAKAGPFLARRTCDPTVVRWRKSLISYVDK